MCVWGGVWQVWDKGDGLFASISQGLGWRPKCTLGGGWLVRRDAELVLTCNKALAGIPCRQGMNAEGRVRDLVTAILDGDGVSATHVWQVGHSVCAIPIVSDVGLLGFALRVLGEKERSSLPMSTEAGWEGGCA